MFARSRRGDLFIYVCATDVRAKNALVSSRAPHGDNESSTFYIVLLNCSSVRFSPLKEKISSFYVPSKDEMRVLVNYLERGAAIPFCANDVTTLRLPAPKDYLRI